MTGRDKTLLISTLGPASRQPRSCERNVRISSLVSNVVPAARAQPGLHWTPDKTASLKLAILGGEIYFRIFFFEYFVFVALVLKVQLIKVVTK